MTEHFPRSDRIARLRRFFAAVESLRPDGPAAVEQLLTALERIPVSALRPEESSMTTPLPPAFSPALDQLLERVAADVRERVYGVLPVPREAGVFTTGGVLAPPISDPTRRPRRTERPRLRVVHAWDARLRLPVEAPENLAGRVAERHIGEWVVYYLAEDPLHDEKLGTYASPRHAFASLDHHLHDMGLVEDLVDPVADVPAEGGVSDAA